MPTCILAMLSEKPVSFGNVTAGIMVASCSASLKARSVLGQLGRLPGLGVDADLHLGHAVHETGQLRRRHADGQGNRSAGLTDGHEHDTISNIRSTAASDP
jgi:hypothetical protein